MSYRGVTSSRTSVTPQKRSNTSPSKTEDFDAQFSDFTFSTTTSSGSKRQRTSSHAMPPPPRPQSVGPTQNPEPSQLDFDWGDDDADFMIAISQFDEEDTNTQETGVDEETLNAMKLMIQEDDFDEGFLDPPPVRPEVERLGRNIVVFSKNKPDPPPLPPSPVQETQQEEALALARRLQHKAQGEATWLRKELDKREKEFEKERKRLRDKEFGLKDQLNDEKAKVAAIEKKSETQNYFYMEEKREMKERLDKYERDSLRGGDRKNLSEMMNSSVVLAETPQPETKPVILPASKARLELRPGNRAMTAARAFCSVHHEISDELKIALLGSTCQADIQAVVTERMEQMIEEINRQPEAVTVSQLETLHGMVLSFKFLTSSRDHRALLTECCSRLLQSMVRSGNSQAVLMVQVIQMVGAAWTPSLLSQDISGDIVTRLSELLDRVKADQVTSKLVTSIYEVISLVTVDPEHCPALCVVGEDCPLKMLSVLTRLVDEAGQDVAEAACRSLLDWLQLSLSLSFTPTWTNNSCPRCTGEIVRNLVLLVESQVSRVVVHQEGLEEVRPLLERGVSVMEGYQDLLGQETWLVLFKECAGIHRTYFWSVEKMSQMKMEANIVRKLESLSM